jgi:uncharacterized protein (TIGR02453 family)
MASSAPARATFPGFSPDALAFLRSLERNNRREWFQPRKSEYDRLIRQPLEELVEGVNREFERFAPGYITPPSKSVFRIYRDTRFAKDKRPYKTHVAAIFHPQALKKDYGAQFYFHFTAKELLVFAGVYTPERDELLAIRQLLAERHEDFRELLSSRKLRSLLGRLQGEKLSRMPAGFPSEHPAGELIRGKQWFLESTVPASAVTSPRMLREIVSRFEAARPVVEFLNSPFLKPRTRRKLPFMAF